MKTYHHILLIEPSNIITTGLAQIIDSANLTRRITKLSDTTSLQERIIGASPDLIIINPTLVQQSQRIILNNYLQGHPNVKLIALIYQYIEPSFLTLFHSTIDIRENPNRIIGNLQQLLSAQHNDENETESYELSQRETDVLIAVTQGLSSKEIAEKLHISIHTVNSHRKNITHKTGIKSAAGLAVYAMLHNLVDKN